VRTILTGTNGISNPSSIVPLSNNTIVVASAAYFTDRDPSLLEVQAPGL
jgi:hypothetical protein